MKRWLLPTLGLLIALAVYFYYDNSKTTTANTDSTSKIADAGVQNSNLATKPDTQENTNKVRDEQFTLYGSNDYAALKAYYEPLAEKGDPYARRMIAQIYDYCALYSLHPKALDDHINVLLSTKPKNKARYLGIQKSMEDRCSMLDKGLPITRELIDFSWAQAVSSKDPVATLQVASSDTTLNSKQIDQLISQALKDPDPETIFAIGDLAKTQGAAQFSPVTGTRVNEIAWQVSACRQAPSMCGNNSPIMTGYCMNGISCDYSNFEEMVRNSIPNEQRQNLDLALQQIQQLLPQQRAIK